jgi:hypothetical protein
MCEGFWGRVVWLQLSSEKSPNISHNLPSGEEFLGGLTHDWLALKAG